VDAIVPLPALEMAETCADCGSEFMIGAKFCHSCGSSRPVLAIAGEQPGAAHLLTRAGIMARRTGNAISTVWRNITFPAWLRYLHFHEIQRTIGLPTGAFIAFMIGLGCVAGAIGVSLFYKASNLAEFQAIQMWRIEWLLGATASFVAGILLKRELVAKGLDAESEYVELINKLNPGMGPEERTKLIKQFRDAVYGQQPDLPGR
jgi:hypothetical protein